MSNKPEQINNYSQDDNPYELGMVTTFTTMAAEFVCQPETWPVFLAWIRSVDDDTFKSSFTLDHAKTMAAQIGLDSE